MDDSTSQKWRDPDLFGRTLASVFDAEPWEKVECIAAGAWGRLRDSRPWEEVYMDVFYGWSNSLKFRATHPSRLPLPAKTAK
jgi:hypothetical protein